MWADFVNGGFEFLAGFMLLNNCRMLYRDKTVKGVSVLSTFFFTLWGYWNLFYYPSLNQWASFFGGILVVSANTIWIIMAIRYRRRGSE